MADKINFEDHISAPQVKDTEQLVQTAIALGVATKDIPSFVEAMQKAVKQLG
ncbi:hypothetical protein [Hymenobacter sediminis]|uniref:hypothetical protein n=1 Tax=Hymenobacter sediminis TaxID=2218621 RepID=UPI0013900B27|nr:hypothetical protein [Hymenobacter sediminis]